ncbi:hypothetical protein ANN_09317 [Periplaneta americana]|uniref:Tc1-like transposase DDE domain-containing protein n=1 Tax=Periplaneta americana TaxID=6978 RepID=A0ABQ8TL09_PERAM|nr:hypothetical protein ANN_09317 [Periplaneta americana]
MAGLCEGGNEPPGSLKANGPFRRYVSSSSVSLEPLVILALRCAVVDGRGGGVLLLWSNTHPHPYHRQLHIAEPRSPVVQEILKTTTQRRNGPSVEVSDIDYSCLKITGACLMSFISTHMWTQPNRHQIVVGLMKRRALNRSLEVISWPPRSPDLNPMDYCVWVGLRAKSTSAKWKQGRNFSLAFYMLVL